MLLITDNDGITRIEHELWKNFQFAGEDGDMLKFFTFTLFQLFSVRHEFVEQMIDDVSLEDSHAEWISQFLSISLDFYVKS